MSRKELPRAGLLAEAVAGRISNREGAAVLRVTPRQFQRLKQRFRLGRPGGAPPRAGPALASAPARDAVCAGAGAVARPLRGLQ